MCFHDNIGRGYRPFGWCVSSRPDAVALVAREPFAQLAKEMVVRLPETLTRVTPWH